MTDYLKDIKPVRPAHKIKLKHAGHNIVQEQFEGNFTRDEIRDYAQLRSNDLKAKGAKGSIKISMYFTNIQKFRGGVFTPFGEPVMQHTQADYDGDDINEDPETYPRFVLWYNRKWPAGGKDKLDKFNDCFWNNLLKPLKKSNPWKTPAEFKIFCGVERADLVPISILPKVDEELIKKCKTKINIRGDETYTSPSTKILVINGKLLNQHYKLDKEKAEEDNKDRVHGIAWKEKHPLLYKFDYMTFPTSIITHDGKKEGRITTEEMEVMREKPNECKYMPVLSQNLKEIGLKEEWFKFRDEANEILQATRGEINPFKTGSARKTALDLFYKLTQHITPDPIEQDEAEWISNTMHGPIIFGEKYEGEGYLYDYCSMYASIMAGTRTMFPIKRPEFLKIDQTTFDKGVQIGFYRCVIDFDEKQKKLFRWSKKNSYTHKDVQFARELGLKTTIINDGRANFLFYSVSSCLRGSQIFSKYVEMLFDLKQRGITMAKDILNVLWGALAQKNAITKTCHQGGEELEIYEDRTIISEEILDYDATKFMVKFVKNKKYFETNYARIAPFLLSYGRHLICSTMKPFVNDVVRCHTDGMFCKKPVFTRDITKYNAGLGDLRYEGYLPKIKVVNANVIEGRKNLDTIGYWERQKGEKWDHMHEKGHCGLCD